MKLDYTPLANAIAQLEKSLAYAHSPDAKAEAVFAIAPDFLLEAQALLGTLRSRSAQRAKHPLLRDNWHLPISGLPLGKMWLAALNRTDTQPPYPSRASTKRAKTPRLQLLKYRETPCATY